MKRVFKHKKKQEQPLLAPLSNGKRLSRFSQAMRNIHVAAIPIGLTLIGSFVLVGILATMALKPATTIPEDDKQAYNTAPTTLSQKTTSATPQNTASIEKPAETAADLFKTDSSANVPAQTGSSATISTAEDILNPLLAASDDDDKTIGVQAYQPGQQPSNAGGPKPENRTFIIPATAPIPAPAPKPAPAQPSNNAVANQASPADGGNATGELRKGVTNSAVNMRSSANRGASVIGVIPGQAQIDVQGNCEWCAVNYQGKSGYIYRSFIRYTD